jgi:general stress protein 26
MKIRLLRCIVVNRKVDEVHKTIYFHTDNRSRKYIDLIKDNRFHCCFMTHGNVQIVVKLLPYILMTPVSNDDGEQQVHKHG